MHAEDHFDDDFLMRLLPDPANTLVFPWKRSAGQAEIYPLAMALR